MDTNAKKNKLIEKINEFTHFHEDGLRLITKIINAVMLVVYGVIFLMVAVNLEEEYGYDVVFGVAFILIVTSVFAIVGWAFCYVDGDEFPKYRILLSPIVINLFIFGGCAAVVIVLVILYYAGCFLFGISIDIADLITKLII